MQRRQWIIAAPLLAASLLAVQVWLADTLVLLAIFVLLAWVEPLGSLLALLVVGAAVWLYRHLTQERLRRWGELRQQAEGRRVQCAQQALAALAFGQFGEGLVPVGDVGDDPRQAQGATGARADQATAQVDPAAVGRQLIFRVIVGLARQGGH